ncbi:MAG: 1-deoxy-D-xylulose-5-phosphate synthase [Phycisphaeraceae bacterium]|nr:1-deoxy-D-xylulose-5-phosphate synthase [Phycisphaeraceae bacterium]
MSLLDQINSPADLRRLPVTALGDLAEEIRSRIIEAVSRVGGHLAPNLGVVELTIALHYVFDFAHDRLLFDVGHQCYPHKLLTGRAHLLEGLRTRAGMAGFPAPTESPYDLFAVGHAGTGISTAAGMAQGDALSNEAFHSKHNPGGRRIVTLIGDASIVNGVAMEGLNNAGTLNRQFLIVLNDNGMSISKPQGAIAQYFDRLRLSHMYGGFKKGARRVLRRLPGGGLLQEAYHKLGEAAKALYAEDSWFEHFGLVTVGPIDGHDFPALLEFLTEARDFDRPMVLHVKTIKGKGLDIAERDATRFHSPAAFRLFTDPDGEPSTGCRVEVATGGRSFTTAFGDAMHDLMAHDPRTVACTAAMPDGTGLTRVLADYPDRAWDVGICESHAMDMMAGLAKTGYKPFFAVYCTFLQRAFDQAFQEVALQGLPVRLCLDRAGLVGGDGAVHHGFCDTALLRTLPGATLLAAMDELSLRAALEFMRTYDDGLSAVRYPRDHIDPRLADTPCPPFVLGKARVLTDISAESPEAPDVAILAFGSLAMQCLDAAASLREDYRVAVYDARFAKPVDAELIRELLTRGIPILTVEDHSIIGGFGAAVIESAAEQRLDASRIVRLGIPDAWIHQDSRNTQLVEAGLDAQAIARALRSLLDTPPAEPPPISTLREPKPGAAAPR